MRVTNTAIQYRTAIVVMTGVIVLGGVYAYLTLPKEANPSIEIPNIVVTTLYPGATPADIENLVTMEIEREIQGISGIDEIRSTSTEGVSTIVIEFTPDVAMDEATQRVRDKVDLAKPDLPPDAEDPIISEIDLSEFPIMTVNLAADYSLTRLKQVAEDLEDQIEALPGVLEVNLVGGLEREVRVDVDLTRLKAYNISFEDISSAIAGENANIPGGSVDVETLRHAVRVDGQFKNPREVENVVIKAPGQNPIYVRDLATVSFGHKDRDSYARLKLLKRKRPDGALERVDDNAYLQVISLHVKKRSGDNILDTAEEVFSLLDSYPLPPGTQVLVTGDQSEDVRDLVRDLENNIISGLVFVIAVLLFFLGLRTSILVGIAIPLSMFASFLIFKGMGQTLNFVILFSLIIALGMLVDNAVVIVENIYRFLEEGHSHWDAARLATGEVGGAVVASTATTVAAFVPMLFWPGIIGEFMSYMPLTLIVTLSCSLFVAVVLNPVITGYLAQVEGHETPMPRAPPWIRPAIIAVLLCAALILGLHQPVPLAVIAGLALILVPLHRFVMKPLGDRFIRTGLPMIVDRYRRFLGWMLVRDYTVRWAYVRNTITLASFVTGVMLCAAGLAVQFLTGSLPSSLVLLVPGGLALATGIIGIVIHSLELAASVVASPLGFALPRILTDNRARLLNAVLGLLFLIIAAFAIAPTGSEFFPDTDPNLVRVNVETRLGTTIQASNDIASRVQDQLDTLLNDDAKTKESLENLVVNVGSGGDAMFGGGAATPEKSSITLNLVDYKDRREAGRTTLRKIRERLASISGAELEITKDQQGPPTGPPVNLEITGPDFDEIIRISVEVKAMLLEWSESGEVPGLVDVRDNLNTGKPELLVRIDRDLAGRRGLTTEQAALMVRTAINGSEASTFRDGEDEFDITVRLAKEDRSDLDALRNLSVFKDGQQTPLVAIADYELTTGLGSITRKDLKRVVTVMANVATGYNATEVLQGVKDKLEPYRKSLQAGYAFNYTGENEDQQEAFSFLFTALLSGVALISMILIAQFNSVTNPVIVMIAVALSLIGVMLGLLVTRLPFSLFTFIGLISLAGIVVNNNIVLIDYIIQLRNRGMAKKDAIIHGGATRLRPVLLTALTTVLGLIPLTFGINIDFVGLLTEVDPDFRIGSQNTQFWGPMGIAIISGLMFATFLTLVIVPVMYSLLDSLAERLLGRSGPGKEAAAR